MCSACAFTIDGALESRFGHLGKDFCPLPLSFFLSSLSPLSLHHSGCMMSAEVKRTGREKTVAA